MNKFGLMRVGNDFILFLFHAALCSVPLGVPVNLPEAHYSEDADTSWMSDASLGLTSGSEPE